VTSPKSRPFRDVGPVTQALESFPLVLPGPLSAAGSGGVGDEVAVDGVADLALEGAQVELLNRRRWRTRVELATAIFEYLEVFHNRRRRHSALGMLTPVEFEARHEPTTAA